MHWIRIAISSAVLGGLLQTGCARADWPSIQSFQSNGTKIVYSVEGKGESVILIHGWLSSAGVNWGITGVSGLLGKNHQVVALDCRGHGLSDKPTKEDAYGDELVEDVVRLMDHLKIKRAHIVGYSMGGIIAGKFLVKHPDRCLSGTLCGMGWLQEGGAGQWGFAQIGKNDPRASALTVCGKSLSKLALTEKDIKSIKLPVEVILGGKDALIRGLYVEPLKKVRPDWPIVEIKDGDHLSTILKPQFKEEIAGWIKKNSSK